jgi:hypothetical protein
MSALVTPRLGESAANLAARQGRADLARRLHGPRPGRIGAADSFGPGTAQPGPLGTHANTLTPLMGGRLPKPVRELRELRFARRSRSSAWLMEDAVMSYGREHAVKGAARPATCGWAAGSHVGVHLGAAGAARFSGVQQCASIWACPTCSAVIRHARADEVQQTADWWEGQGREFLFVTFTVRHKMADPLERTMDALTEAYTATINGAPWKRFARVHGIAHFIKTVEVTLSWDNGWHAHLHVLFFVDLAHAAAETAADASAAWAAAKDPAGFTRSGRPSIRKVKAAERRQRIADDAAHAAAQGIGKDRARELHSWLSDRWADMVVAAGGRRPDREHGVNIRTARDGKVVALYLTKVQDGEAAGWGVGKEMARADLKRGRGGSMVPFELLDLDGLTADEVERNRLYWLEFVRESAGRRAMTWSRGLKEAAGLKVLEDDELMQAEADEVEADEVVALIAARHWVQVRSDPAALARILELVEADRLDQLHEVVPWQAPRQPKAA